MVTTAMRSNTQRHGYLVVAVVWALLLTSTPAAAQIDTTKTLITLHGRHLTPEKLRHLLKKQTGCETHIALGLEHLPPFSLDIHDISFSLINTYLVPYGVMVKAESKTLFIKPASSQRSNFPEKAPSSSHLALLILVMNEHGEPLPGSSVSLPGATIHTHKDGQVLLANVRPGDTIQVSHIGRKPVALVAGDSDSMAVILLPSPDELGETQVINYYSGPKHLQTGAISSIHHNQIDIQPVSNTLLTLSGLVPGLLVTQTSGVHGSGVRLLVRGPGSIANGTDPLILIDRVPFAPNNQSMANLPSGSAAGSLSPFSFINPADIESIEVLKDADATAIYGSRGAGGVILITTKKHQPGDDRWGMQLSTGMGTVTRRPALLNTTQYVQMRREALHNDGLPVDATYAPDLVLWDTTRYTDFGKSLIGGLARASNADAWYSDGGLQTKYRLSAHYTDEGNVFPGHPAHRQATLLGHLVHCSRNGRWTLEVAGLAGKDWNNQYVNDLTAFQFLAPHCPALRDSAGRLIFQSAGITITNPDAYLQDTYAAISSNFLANAYGYFLLTPHWALRGNIGFSSVRVDEVSKIPMASQDPDNQPTASSYFANTASRGWIVEPQLERKDTMGKWAFSFLLGGTWQAQHNLQSSLSATGLTSDALLDQPSAAPYLTADRQLMDYHYAAISSRIHLNWDNTVLINMTARRDGSSRFGPGRQFGNFGAIGWAWIFSKSRLFREHLSFISFGKLRGSYGLTGNDQIGDYRYRTAWSTTTGIPYQNMPGFYPTTLTNPNLGWEKVLKEEIAIEAGGFRDRLSFTAAFFRERCTNQLVPYPLPLQTGFSSELRNSGATLVLSGWEFNAQVQVLHTKKVQWTAGAQITIPSNRLAAYPHLELSPYASSLVIGQSINVLKTYRLLGVDRDSGIYRFASVNKGRLGDSDRVVAGNWDVHWFGGIASTLRTGPWQLDLHVEVRVQSGADYQASLFSNIPPGALNPGMLTNETQQVLDRWTKKGDRALYQQLTTTPASVAGKLINTYTGSSALLADASFVRLKTLTISWRLPEKWNDKMGCAGGRVFIETRNLLTLTSYRGTDPETQGLTLPPLRVMAAGIRMTFK